MYIIIIAVIIIISIFIFIMISSEKEEDYSEIQEKVIEPIKVISAPQSQKTQQKTAIKSSYLMSNREKQMFFELKQALPEYHVFVQVALGAILWTSSYATRNKFSQKIADFVVTDKDFNILAVIELDDKSHIGKEDKDRERDEMVREAGYKALRYPHIPTQNRLRTDILS